MPRVKKQKTEVETKKIVEKKAVKQPSFYQAVGRRKESTARVRLYVTGNSEVTIGSQVIKNGDIVVNKRPIGSYFAGEISKRIYLEPFRTTNTVGRFAVSAIISGGGLSGQLGAFVHGTARALEKADREKFRPILKKRGFLTRDSRAKERRKAGLAQKARAKKQSPKR